MKPIHSQDLHTAALKLDELRDLSDFCTNWGAVKPLVSQEVLERSQLSAESQNVIEMLVQLADRTAATS